MPNLYPATFTTEIALTALAHSLPRPVPRPMNAVVIIGFISFLVVMGYVATQAYAGYMADCPYCYSFSL